MTKPELGLKITSITNEQTLKGENTARSAERIKELLTQNQVNQKHRAGITMVVEKKIMITSLWTVG